MGTGTASEPTEHAVREHVPTVRSPVRGLLGRYDREPAALRIYGLILFAIAVMRVAIWLYATSRPHLLWHRLDHHQRSRRSSSGQWSHE